MTRRRWTLLAVLAAGAALLVARAASALSVEYAWYAAMHATALWRARLVNGALLTGAIALAGALFVFANLYVVRRSIVAVVLPHRVGNVDIAQAVPGRHLTAATAIVSLCVGVLLALPPEPWTELALARYGIPFGEAEPYFRNDLGFFIYWLPLETALYVRALVMLLVTTCLVVMVYFALTPSLRWERNRLTVSPYVRRHAAVVTAFVFAVLAWSYRLDAYGLLSHGTGAGGAFAYADHHVGIAANQVLAVLTIAAGIVTAGALWRAQIRTAFILVSVTIVLPLLVFHVVVPLVARAGDASDVARREAPYTVIRAVATRHAYALDRMRLAADDVGAADTGAAALALAAPRVAVWDPTALTVALERHERRGIVPAATGWQWSPGGFLEIAVARGTDGDTATPPPGAPGVAGVPEGAREGARASAPAGPALIRVRAAAADDRGAPQRVDSLGRAATDDASLPAVLIFEGAVGPAIVADSAGRLPAPTIGGAMARLMYALSEQHLSLLTAELPGPRPTVLLRRDVRERVDALAPFFAQGSTITPAVAGDSLYWVVDLYSAADAYPLSAHFALARAERSYFQHAARAFVHAATGRVMLVADETLDPVAWTWVRCFPELFIRSRALPAGLAAQAPPAVDGAIAMAAAFADAGVEGDPAQRAGGRHHLVVLDGAEGPLVGGPVPCIATAASSDVGSGGGGRGGGGACAWNFPIVDDMGRLLGLVDARGGASPGVVWQPLARPGPRWTSVVDRLAHATDSDSAFRRDAPLVRGRVRAFLAGGRVTFAQPAYAWRTDAPPALAGVAVATDDSAWSAPTLIAAAGGGGARSAAAGQGARATNADTTRGSGPFRLQVRAVYDAMQDALRRGDLAAFGSAYGALGHLVGRGAPTGPIPRGVVPAVPSDTTGRRRR